MIGAPSVFIQWKGTEVCLDFYCECSPDHTGHFDGFGAHAIECHLCGRKYTLPHLFQLLPWDEQHQPVRSEGEE